ncbi:ABC transporter permease [Lichenibacterium dinghuense]|uniref:ABC transporter permease n=1 Tax=Lichenibacterium dinghuense TaxID=2895977 RepID=UPI001F3B1101|nr:ABC transporter permease [Lichenibacterium sp. 6Y81]
MSTTAGTKPPPAAAAPPTAVPRRRGLNMGLVLSLTLFGLLLLMWIALSLSTDSFLTDRNVTNLMRQGAMVAIIAVGETFVIITAGIDLSVGAVVGVSTVAVSLMLVHGFGIPAAVALTILMGVAIGAFHGFGIVQLGLPPFIMTLASLTALRGIGLLVTNGSTISGLPNAFTDFSLSSFLGIPSLFWMVILVAVPAYVLLGHTRLGRYLYAIGSNPEAARLTGVNIKAMTYLAYIVSAGLAAFVGVLLASRIGIGNATQGEGWELQAIASSVIGGTSLFGAVGTIQGPLLGSFILTTINNGANLLQVNAFWQRIITGGLIIVIVYFDQLRRKRR